MALCDADEVDCPDQERCLFKSIIKAKMAHKIGQYETKRENEPASHSRDDQSSTVTSEQGVSMFIVAIC